MNTLGFSKTSFKLLRELEANNNKIWMAENREAVREHLQDPFAFMLDCVGYELFDHDIALSGSKKTMFRLHRDIRFSKNKVPYNLYVSGLLTPSGIKSDNSVLAYVRLDVSGGLMAAGCYNLSAKQLVPFRDEIIENPEKFQTLLSQLETNGLSLNYEGGLKSMPRGYAAQSSHEHSDALKLKRFIVREELTESMWCEQDMVTKLSGFIQRATPLLNFCRTMTRN